MANSAQYKDPTAMEPLLPDSSGPELAELTSEVLRKAGRLSGLVPSAITRGRIAHLVREMNSYYSNLIEGHKTLPRDIERALRSDYSGDQTRRENQHLSRAHIEVEELMVKRLMSEPALSIHSADFLQWLHREFYQRLPGEMQFGKDQDGKPYRIQPGALRDYEVTVHRHHPPPHAALPKFLNRFAAFYEATSIKATNQLVALAAAHHRLAWIHPFGDGNGRVARLYSHASLVRRQVDSHGLWTLSRGLARRRGDYYEALGNADKGRWNDLDSRGNLSDRFLAEFCIFFLRTVLDQVNFMAGLLQLDHLCLRIDRYLQFEALHLSGRRRERLAKLLRAAVIDGAVERGRVAEIVGLSPTASREIIRLGLEEELLDSPSPKGPLSVVFSAKTLDAYFPKLFTDIPVEGER
jgi:Fic family protein